MLPGMCNVIFIFLLYRHLVDKDRQQVNVLLSNIFRVFWGGELNPPQRPLCVLEREKMKVGGGKWMGRGKGSFLFPLAIVYHALTIFKLLPFFLGIPSVCLCRGERRWNYDVCRLIRLSGSRVNVACQAGVLRVSSHIPASRKSLLWDRNA